MTIGAGDKPFLVGQDVTFVDFILFEMLVSKYWQEAKQTVEYRSLCRSNTIAQKATAMSMLVTFNPSCNMNTTPTV